MSAAPALAVIGHNSESYLKMVEADPAIIYRDDEALPGLVSEIDKLIADAASYIGSKKGREAIASLAHSISRRKTPILDAGKKLTEDWRKKTGEVNSRKSMVEQHLDALRDKARAPLDAWEAAEKSRMVRVETAMSTLRDLAKIPASYSLDDFDDGISVAERFAIDDDFGDLSDAAEDLKVEALTALRAGRAAFIKAEAERAELARLRAAEEERLQVESDREAKHAQEAAEAELIAAAERRAAEQAEARVTAEREAEAARVKAQQDAELAEERRKAREAQDALAAEQQRQRDAKAAEEREAAQRAADEKARQENIEHRSKIMREAKEAIMTCGPTEGMAKQIVLAICAGTIAHTSISF